MSSAYFTDTIERKTVDSRDEFLLGVKRLLDVEQGLHLFTTKFIVLTRARHHGFVTHQFILASEVNVPGTPKSNTELFTTYDALIYKIGALVERRKKAEKIVLDDIEERWRFMESW